MVDEGEDGIVLRVVTRAQMRAEGRLVAVVDLEVVLPHGKGTLRRMGVLERYQVEMIGADVSHGDPQSNGPEGA